MKPFSTLTVLLISIAIFVSTQTTYAQSRSNIGFGYGLNYPISSDYKLSTQLIFRGDVKLAEKWALTIALAYDKINSTGRFLYSGGYYVGMVENIDMGSLRLAGKYFINDKFFVRGGVFFFAAGGNEDIAGLGFGSILAGGYNLNLDNHNTLELSFATDIAKIRENASGPVVIPGIKVAYVFNFRKPR